MSYIDKELNSDTGNIALDGFGSYARLKADTKSSQSYVIDDPLANGYPYVAVNKEITLNSEAHSIANNSTCTTFIRIGSFAQAGYDPLDNINYEEVTGYISTSGTINGSNYQGQLALGGQPQYGNSGFSGNYLARSTQVVLISQGTISFFSNSSTKALINSTSPYAYKLAGTTWGTFSDQRLKKNFRPISDALSKINALNPTHYEYINTADGEYPSGTRTGFIAQEVEQVFPGHVGEQEPMLEADKALLGEGVKAKVLEADWIPYLVKAIQELSAEVTSLKAQVSALQPAP